MVRWGTDPNLGETQYVGAPGPEVGRRHSTLGHEVEVHTARARLCKEKQKEND